MDKSAKSAEAFRTISEVSDILEVPQHVLRFWEGKFSQIKPMKRGGNRRYYRPEDLELLRAITHLLYTDGYTIKGVQKLLRENGVRATVNSHITDHGAFRDDRSEEDIAAASGALVGAESDDEPIEAIDAAANAATEALDDVSVEPLANNANASAHSAADATSPGASKSDAPKIADAATVIAELQSIQAILKG